MTDMCEIRFELPASDVSVLDGYCSATGKSRTDIMRNILKDWSDAKLREATLICRVAGVNPAASEYGRKAAA
mgnify:FL=1|jgi:hypothetical protein